MRTVNAFAGAILWACLILVLSIMPGGTISRFKLTNLFQWDKLGHLIVYAILVGLILWGIHRKNKPKRWPLTTIATVLILCIGYGVALELVQHAFFSGRHFDSLDIIANITGCFAGLFSLKLFPKIK